MRLYVLLVLLMFAACALEQPEKQLPRQEIFTSQEAVTQETYVVETPERPVTLDTLPAEYQVVAGLSWCPEGEVEDVQGIAHIYKGLVDIRIRGEQVQACEVEGSLDGERLFLAYSTQDGKLSKTVMYLHEAIDGSSELWKEGALICEQFFDSSGSALDQPDCS
jgi:hypothetical protein